MSWEAWGTPPDDEPELCPLCDNTQHTPDKCEVAASEAHSRKHYEGVIALLLQEQERKLTRAYAEGRKDEREELTPVLLAASSDLGCLMDFVGESDAINMIGAREAYGAAGKTIKELTKITADARCRE